MLKKSSHDLKARLPHSAEIERERLQWLADKYRLYGRDDRKHSASPLLLIPLQPAGTYFWENFSIGLSSDPPAVGVPNFLKVAIRNCGALPALATVADFRWGKPSLGLDERNLYPAGISLPTLIEKGKQKEIHAAKPWIPQDGGHQCLMVTCWAMNDSQGLQRWQPQTERRCAQRNVTVAAMKVNTSMTLHLDFANLLPMRAVHTVMASVERVMVPRKLAEKTPSADLPVRVLAATVASRNVRMSMDARLLARQVPVQRAQEDFVAQPVALGLHSRLSEGLGTIGPAHAKEALANLLMGSDRIPQMGYTALAGMSVLHEVSLHPHELRNVAVELEVPQGSRRGDFLVYRMVQVTEGMLLGGYTAILHVE